MKIIENLATLTVQQIAEMAKNAGVSENRLDRAVSASYLPEIGSFTTAGFDGEKIEADSTKGIEASNTTHIRVATASGDSISMSRVQLSGFDGEPDLEKDVLQSAKDTFYLRSNCTLNPSLAGNQAVALKKMIGKHFVANEYTVKRSKFVNGGVTDRDQIEIVPVKGYKIHLFDTKALADKFLADQKKAVATV